ncbi:MAG TPA: transcription termination/antitermination protein NusG [Bacteriovoracaceae bacterium]|nr:transcription termination/antitermination protein NusG [Bacteriovoracaceae bacterium]
MANEKNDAEIVNNEDTAAETAVGSVLAKGDTPEFKWYVAKTMTGQENKVAKALKERAVNFKLTEYISEIIVPEETVVNNVNGKKRTFKKKFFPGYVLIKMVMTDSVWHMVKDTDKITGFIGGTKGRPTAISDKEAAVMTNQVVEGFKPRANVNFSEGENVKVIEGPFTSFIGVVESVNEKGKLRVSVSIFGRPTPVELDFSQVQKVTQ